MYEKTLRELIDELNRLTALYDAGTPEVSDEEWDNMYFELKKREEIDGVIYPDSPTQKISFTQISKLNKTEHSHPMLSLAKTKKVEELRDFVRGHDWLAMFKMDGLTCSLEYDENGNLVKAETRGNGIVGEDILHNIKVIKNVPKHIPTKERVIVDGEIICTIDDFEDFKEDYKNPRNFAAGSIRLLDSKECASRKLRFVAWDLVKGCEDIDFFIWRLEKLDDWGFEVVPAIGDAETVDDAIAWFDEERKTLDRLKNYPIDGYVFKFESKKYGEELGRTDHHFKNAIAYKFYDETYTTRMKGIQWTMGRTGVLTPVAIFEPIEIDGSTVERASLHNVSIMREILGDCAYGGQQVEVFKANQIIPQIKSAVKMNYGDVVSRGGYSLNDNPSEKPCPCCGAWSVEVVESNDGVLNAVCTNPQCEGKLTNRIDHFAGKKGLDIKGLSEKTIEKLIDWGWINGLTDIFNLEQHKTEWMAKNGFGAASVGKILDAINAAKNGANLASFISSIGIPLVGTRVSKEIVKYYPTWEDFRNAVGGNWSDLDGFGPEMESAINSFDYTEADEIAEILTFEQPKVQTEVSPAIAINGKTFVITGKLSRKRDEIKAEIESLGGKVTGSVSSKTDYLICNDKNSTTGKSADAKRLGIPVITEEEYLNLKS